MEGPVMTDEPRERPALPPYLPYRTFRSYIEGLRASGIPAVIDRTVMRNRSGAEQTGLLGTLQFLGLITASGKPTDGLKTLVEATGEDQRKIFHDVLVMAYPFLMSGGFRLESATPSQMQTAFGEAGLSGGTIQKAIAFFLAAAQEAQIPMSSYLKVRAPRGASSRRRPKSASGRGNSTVEADSSEQPVMTSQKSEYQMLFDILDTDSMDDEEQKAVWTLIRFLKKRNG